MTKFYSIFIFITTCCFSQQKKISGVVQNSAKETLPFCSIQIKNKNSEARTDGNGKFSIYAEVNDTLVISNSGYKNEEEIISENSTFLDIILKENEALISDVVITSLGIKKDKRQLSYSAQEVNGEAFTQVKDPNLINTLAGKVAGMVVNRSVSGPGGSTKVVIRGNSSTRNNQPLYVIDGVPMLSLSANQPNGTFGGVDAYDGGDLVSQLNPENYESITVLKGAAATALYGILGANGVIVLNSATTTKKKLSASISSTTTFEKISNLPQFQHQYRAESVTAPYSWTDTNEKENFANHVPDFFNTGVNQTTAFNLRTSGENSFTNISLANVQAKGVLPENKLDRYNLGLQHGITLLPNKLKLIAAVNYADTKTSNRPNIGLYLNPLTGLYLMSRGNGNNFSDFKDNFEVFDPDRNLMAQSWPIKNDAFQQNPYWVTYRNQSKDQTSLFYTNWALDYKVKTWLSLSGRYSYTLANTTFDKKLYATTSTIVAGENGRYYVKKEKSTQKYADLLANFNTRLTNDFSFNGTLGTSFLHRKLGDGTVTDGNLLFANIFNISNLEAGAKQKQYLNSESEVQSLFATANFTYKNYLFLQASSRKDWSSTLVNTSKNSIFYPSVGISGIISNMITLPKQINYLKLRTSYSEVGNDLTPFITSPLNTIENGEAVPPMVGIDPNRPLQPELKREWEMGAEMALFNNRFNFELSYYTSNTSNQYVEVANTAVVGGYPFYAVNVGKISNKGIEFFASVKALKNTNLNWTVSTNFSKNINKVKELKANSFGEVILTESGSNGYQFALQEGHPFGIIRGRVMLRDGQGRILLNENGDILLSENFENVGNANPDFLLSLGNTFTYKDFFASFLIDGRFGGNVMSMTESMNDFYGVSKASGIARANGGVAINAVYPDGTPFTGLYDAKKYYGTIGNRDGALGEYVYDATNIILREISVGYTFRKKQIKFIDSFSISLIARNLFFISKKAPFDPNISLSTGEGLQGIDIFGLPATRTFGLNIKCNF